MHVLCCCKMQLGKGITQRHNAIQNRVADSVRKQKDIELHINRKIVPNSKRRPDITMIDRKNKKVAIIDVTCPYDKGNNAIDKATAAKVEKYQEEADVFRKDGLEVYCGAITIGALGTWCLRNDQSLHELGLSNAAIRKLRPILIGETIEHSKNVFWTHILADKYEKPNNAYNPDNPWTVRYKKKFEFRA